jgi:hypothetical protein
MVRTVEDFEQMPLLELLDEVIDLSRGDLWDGMSSRQNSQERDIALEVIKRKLKLIDEHAIKDNTRNHQVFTETELRRAYNAGFMDRCGIAEGDHSHSFDKYIEINGLK